MSAMVPRDKVERGLESFRRKAWADAYAQLSAADEESMLDPEDLVNLAMAAYLIGRDTDSLEVLARAYHHFLSDGDSEGAIRCTFWLGFHLMNKGDVAQAGGWFARGRRLLEEGRLDCVEQGYLLVPMALQDCFAGDFPTAYETFDRAAEIGSRFDDPDLMALAGLGRGQSLIGLGETAKGVSLLDEVMVAVMAEELSAILAGVVYCAVIEACHETFDVRRAQEWTAALTDWCAAQPDLVPYRGQCLVHRAEIMQLHGAWPDAMDEVRRARERLSDPPGQPAVGMAFYQQGELHRLRGEFAEAEEAYRQAHQWGRSPQPGLAQLRLAQGQVEAAKAAISLVLDEAQGRVTRSKVLPAQVEIMLAADDTAAARAAADELSEIAEKQAPLLHALSAHAQGAVLLAEGDVKAALGELRRASRAWQELEAPYEAARTRVLIALACRQLGDDDSAYMELDAARSAFRQLGAAPDFARVEELSGAGAPMASNGLTGREVEVLQLVATGKTNREIATDLVISEKTVARHLSNIFIKVGVTSRAAATAYAYQHDIV